MKLDFFWDENKKDFETALSRDLNVFDSLEKSEKLATLLAKP